MTAGYSGTPLAKKLGVKHQQRTWRWRMPESVSQEITSAGVVPKVLKSPAPGLEMAHIFVTARGELTEKLGKAREQLAPSGTIWVSWPKKASKVPTDITEHVVREEAFPLGLVDVKVCAVDETWTGLKLVIRVSERK